MTRAALIALIAIAAGCDGQTVDTEDTGSTDTGEDTPGYTVEVAADAGTADVDLSDLSTVDQGGDMVVPLTAVLGASALEVDWSSRTYDFAASDGFRPSDKDCDPLDYTAIESGWLHPESGNLGWDDALALPGCYYVDGVVLVDVQDAAGR